MKKTLIVSVFAGCGKTWLTQHQEQYGYMICDSDSSSYEKSKWMGNLLCCRHP